MTCLSSYLASKSLDWRNEEKSIEEMPFCEKSYFYFRVVSTEVAFVGLAVLAFIETTAYGILSFISIVFYPCTTLPNEFFISLLSSALFTTAKITYCLFFQNNPFSKQLSLQIDSRDAYDIEAELSNLKAMERQGREQYQRWQEEQTNENQQQVQELQQQIQQRALVPQQELQQWRAVQLERRHQIARDRNLNRNGDLLQAQERRHVEQLRLVRALQVNEQALLEIGMALQLDPQKILERQQAVQNEVQAIQVLQQRIQNVANPVGEAQEERCQNAQDIQVIEQRNQEIQNQIQDAQARLFLHQQRLLNAQQWHELAQDVALQFNNNVDRLPRLQLG